MKEDFKKWIFELLGLIYEPENEMVEKVCCDISLLIKAMWQINRDGKYTIIIDGYNIRVVPMGLKGSLEDTQDFKYSDHNNSELEALTQALTYIYENKIT